MEKKAGSTDGMADITGDDEQLLELALFAGAGGGILGGKLLGWRTVCAVEINAYAASVLIARQNDGCLEPFPVWDDIATFRSDNTDCAGMFEMLRAVRHRLVVSGGFPCTNVSVGGDGSGIGGSESRLWSEQARILCEIRPRFGYVENSAALTGRGLHRVLGDLAEMGFDAEWGVFSAADAGARHERERIWICASNSDCSRLQGGKRRIEAGLESLDNLAASQLYPQHKDDLPEPALLGGSNGVPYRMDRTRSIGNAQFPAVAAAAWRILSNQQ